MTQKPKTYFTTNLNRNELWIMETPQCAKKDWLEEEFKKQKKDPYMLLMSFVT